MAHYSLGAVQWPPSVGLALGHLSDVATGNVALQVISSRCCLALSRRSVKEPSLSLMLLSWPFIGELAYQSSLAVSSTSLFTRMIYKAGKGSVNSVKAMRP